MPEALIWALHHSSEPPALSLWALLVAGSLPLLLDSPCQTQQEHTVWVQLSMLSLQWLHAAHPRSQGWLCSVPLRSCTGIKIVGHTAGVLQGCARREAGAEDEGHFPVLGAVASVSASGLSKKPSDGIS